MMSGYRKQLGQLIAPRMGRGTRLTGVLAAGLTAGLATLALAPPALADTGATWTGADTSHAPAANWSNDDNWQADNGPSPGGALNFPNLISCAAGSACYDSVDNLGALSSSELTI